MPMVLGPSDIYWEDRKISGTLIETRLSAGVLKDVVIGTGINVNQEEFFSDAPNPVSLFQILGKRCPVSLDTLLDQILRKFSEYYCQLEAGDSSTIERHYHQSLYRRDGYYWYEPHRRIPLNLQYEELRDSRPFLGHAI